MTSPVVETALAALYRAIRARLIEPGAPWGERAYADRAPDEARMPYVVFFWSGGGEINQSRHQDAEIVVAVKAVSDSQAEAFECAAWLSARLNDQGAQDKPFVPLSAGNVWHIKTATQESVIHLNEMFASAVPHYHEGHQYRFDMEVQI